MNLVYWKLELKRAWKRLPNLWAGAMMLALLVGMIALAASRILYDGQAVGNVSVGVAVPEEDALAKQVIKMISSLESVNSICDFQYMEREKCFEELEKGTLYAVLDVPEGFVESIMNGSNLPVKIWLSRNTGTEGKVFQELADAGALTLSASQAGIYAGNELYQAMGLQDEISRLEWDLNKIYMDYSLGRAGYFRHQEVQAAGDVSVSEFYLISMYVLFLFLSAIPVSGYLQPIQPVMGRKLKIAGVGRGSRVGARINGMAFLMAAASLPVVAGAVAAELVEWSLILLAVWLMTCVAASGVVVLVYQLTGNLLGGIMILFLLVTGQHFVSGGFLPLVFLPVSMQKAAPVLPSGILMDTAKMGITQTWDWQAAIKSMALAGISWMLGTAAEVKRQ